MPGETLRESGDAHLAEWLAAPGRTVWFPLASVHVSGVASWAGHAWAPLVAAEDPIAPHGVSWPGVEPPRAELAWLDSLQLEESGGSAWWGWSPGFVRTWAPRGRLIGRAQALLSLARGGFEREEHGFEFDRRDSLSALGLAIGERRRGSAEALDRAGEHLYSAAAAGSWRDLRLRGSYTSRASAARLAGGEEERLEGESGDLGAQGAARGLRLVARGGRGRGVQESLGSFAYSRREAQAWWAEGTLGPEEDERWEMRAAWRRAEVVRFRAASFGPLLASEWWVAGRRRLAAAGGEATVTLGAGGHTGKRAFVAAPGADWTLRRGQGSASLWLGRALTPVWTDLRPGQAPFLQDTWLGGVSAGWRAPESASGARLALTLGRTRHRAVLPRRPLLEEGLRSGAAADAGPYEFGGLEAQVAWRRGPFGLGARGQALSRDPSALQPRVDPGHSGLLWAEGGLRLFAGDLDLRLRVEAEGVGPREGEAPGVGRLTGYGRLHAMARLALGDAMLVLRAHDLSDRRPEQVWIDRATGLPARDPGRELRLALTWRVFD